MILLETRREMVTYIYLYLYIYIYIYKTKKKHYLPHTNPCEKPLSSLFPFLSLSPFATKEGKMLLGGTNELIGKVKPQAAGLRLGTLLRGKGDAH